MFLIRICLLISVCFLSMKAFASMSLLEAYTLALKNDNILKSAEHEYNAAATRVGQSRASLLPSMAGSARMTHYDTNTYDEYDTTEYALSFQQPVINIASLYEYKQSKKITDSAKSRYKIAEQDMMFRVVDSYIALLSAEDNVTLAVSEKSAVSQQLSQAEKLYKAGVLSVTNVHDWQSEFDMVEYKLVDMQNKRDIKYIELESIIGVEPGKVSCTPREYDFVEEELQPIEYWQELSINNSEVIRYYKSQIDYYDMGVKKNYALNLPTLNLQASYTETDTNNYFKTERSTYKSIGAQINIPIFSGGSTYYRIKESQESYQKVLYDYRSALADTKKRVKESYLQVYGLKSQIKALLRLAESNKISLESNNKSFAAGETTLVDVVTAQKNLYSTLNSLSNAKYDYYRYRVKLLLDAGVLSEADINNLNTIFVNECEENK